MSMKHYGLIGCPLGHSLSPAIHAALFSLSGVNADYKLITVPPEELKSSYDMLRGLDGFNVTIPHKIPIISMCGRLDERAARYGAVNCVKTGAEAVGYNTDVTGFTKSIEMLGANLSADILLIGCGGVGRMMAIETALCGGRLTIAARSTEKAETVKAEILGMKPDADVTISEIDNVYGKSYELVMNSTPVGMLPNTDDAPIDISRLCGVKYAFDVIYNPLQTRFLTEAAACGIKTLNGLPMLVLQAAKAHEIWYGAEFSSGSIAKIIKETELLIK